MNFHTDFNWFVVLTSSLLPDLLDVALQGGILLVAAGLVTLVLRRAAASLRHLVWAVAMAGLLLLPLLAVGLPSGWSLAIFPESVLAMTDALPAQSDAVGEAATLSSNQGRRERYGPRGADGSLLAQASLPSSTSMALPVTTPLDGESTIGVVASNRPAAETAATATSARVSIPAWVMPAWGAGCLVVLAYILAGSIAVLRLRRHTRPVDHRAVESLAEEIRDLLGIQRPIRLRSTESTGMPVTFGLFRPTVLLPAGATRWPQIKLRSVLLHEFAHVARRDCLSQAIARLALAIHWFNPLAWLAVKRLRIERETACDDLVLQAGQRPVDYADQLLDIVRSLRVAPLASIAGLTMARRSHFEGRLLAILDARRCRRPLTRGALAVVLAVAAALVVPLAGASFAGSLSQPAAVAEGVPSQDQDAITVAADGGAMYRSIQKAIDAAPAGATVRIAPGRYEENLVVSKPLTLEGSGWDRTTIAGTFDLSAAKDPEVMREFQRRAKEAQSDADRSALRVEFWAKYGPNPPLDVRDVENVVVRNLKFTYSGEHPEGSVSHGAAVSLMCCQAELENCAVVGSPVSGIGVGGGCDVEIRRCLVAAVGATGISVGRTSASPPGDIDPNDPGAWHAPRVRIVDCELRACRHLGIVFTSGVEDALVEGCRISGSAWHGIRYDDAAPMIRGNLIFRNERMGIYASGKTKATVTGNVFLENGMAGISCWRQGCDTIEGNTFACNIRSGVEILENSNPVLRKNIFFANPTAVATSNVTDTSPYVHDQESITFEQNIFWQNEQATSWVRPANGGGDPVTGTIQKSGAKGNLESDPLFKDAEGLDFSLLAESPALSAGIGAVTQPALRSRWPAQPEEKPFTEAREVRREQAVAATTQRDAWSVARPWIADIMQIADRAKRDAAVETMRQALQGSDLLQTYAALIALVGTLEASYDKEAFHDLVLPLVRSGKVASDGGMQVKAFYALYRTKFVPEELELVLEAARNPTPAFCESGTHLIVLYSQGKIRGKAAEAVLRLLDKGRGSLARNALSGLWGAEVSPEVEARLIEMATTSDRELRHDVIYFALSTLANKSKAVIQELFKAAEDPDPNNFTRAIWGLGHGVPRENQSMVADFLLKLFEARGSAQIRGDCLRTIGAYGNTSHVPALEALAANELLSDGLRTELRVTIKHVRGRPAGR